VGSIILAILVGAIIGVLARIAVPGKQSIGMIAIVVVGGIGGLIGSAVAGALGFRSTNGGVAWIAVVAGAVVAIVMIGLYQAVAGRGKGARR
jgi:uncharacterized membrane protein YeaQ/YmgE (transglycosylase-associated protein family)